MLFVLVVYFQIDIRYGTWYAVQKLCDPSINVPEKNRREFHITHNDATRPHVDFVKTLTRQGLINDPHGAW